MTTRIETARPEDAAVLTNVIEAAFHPLAPCAWLVPHPIQRHFTLREYFRILVDHTFEAGLVYTTAELDAVALWLPVGEAGPITPHNYNQRLKQAVGPHLDRFRLLDEQFEAHHPKGVAHHYLAILAVRPDNQGLGLGKTLLAAHHRHLDETGTAAYLEASDQVNRVWYVRHGYTDRGDPIDLDGVPMYPMWRRPYTEHREARPIA